MKLLEIAFFFLAVLCVCTVGEDGIPSSTVSTTISTSGSKSVTESVNTSTLQVTPSQAAVSVTAAVGATKESTPTTSTSSLPNATRGITQDTTTQLLVKVSTATKDESFSTINTTQASGTQLPQNESSDASTTKGSFFTSTVSPARDTPASGTSGLPMSFSTKSTTFVSRGSSPGEDKDGTGSDISYSSVILPIVITLIVITLSVFSLVALYKMCQKKTPERQENGTEQAQSDKDGVKLLSVKTTSSETGEHSSHGKSKTRQLFTSQQ